jgi:two-component system sensor histidine kinase RegB
MTDPIAAEATSDPAVERVRVNLTWLIKLRWAALGGQLLTIAVVCGLLRVSASSAKLLGVIALGAATNAGLAWWASRLSGSEDWRRSARVADRLIGVSLLTDVALLTALLGLSGGPHNPFAVYYFVNLSLAAVVYPGRPAWLIVGFACACIALLFVWHAPLAELDATLGGAEKNLWLPGSFVALLSAAPIVMYFTSRMANELEKTQIELGAAQQKQARMEKLQALGTLAAGAAHELASPLSTIAVVAKELALSLQQGRLSEGAVEDAQLIREEVARCRTILQQMAADAGQHAGEGLQPVAIGLLAPAVIEGCRDPERVRTILEPGVENLMVFAPRHLLAQALRGLVNNALDASLTDSPVEMSLSRAGDYLAFVVKDAGHGMQPDVLARAGEPFFTTKEVGKGMGLGLFLARTVVERLEGQLELHSRPNGGTEARVHLPLAHGV